MKHMIFDEKAIKLLKEYNLRFIKPNTNEIYLQSSSESEEKRQLISKYLCIDCNQFPLVAYKCNDQNCQKILCYKCLEIQTHDELDLSEVYDCMDCHSLKFCKYDLEKSEDLKDLKFICPNKNPQILEELAFPEIKSHIENCEFLKLCKCIQCGTVGCEAEMVNHIKECQEAIILCEHCNEETERKFHEIHLSNCEKLNPQINLDSSSLNVSEVNLDQKIESEYEKLTEVKINNLSNNEFVVASEKEENFSIDKKSESEINNDEEKNVFINDEENINNEDINNDGNENQFEKEKIDQCSCDKFILENNLLREKIEELESKINNAKCDSTEENAKISIKIAILEKQIGNLNKTQDNNSKGSDWKRIICSFLLFGMFIQQLIILYLIKSKYGNVQLLKKDFDSFNIYTNKGLYRDDNLDSKNKKYQAYQEVLLEKQRKENERIKKENERKLNLLTKKSGELEKFLSEKGFKFASLNKQLENKLKNLEKIYDASKQNLQNDFYKEIEKFKSAISQNNNLIYFLNLKIRGKKLSIGFYHKIEFSQKDFKSYKFLKDKNSFLMFSGNKFILADEKKEAQFFFLDNYFFIIGFNNGGGLYLRNKTLTLNLSKLSNQFKVAKADFDSLEELNGKNLFEHFENLQVFKINSDIEN